jgi:hypothetical protein
MGETPQGLFMANDVRPSPIAGTWYPGEESALRSALDGYLGEPPESSVDDLVGLLAPHAGMRYSGPVAGRAFRHLPGRQYDVVVVIGPSHYPYNHRLLTTGHDAFETPLGEVPIALDHLTALREQIDMTRVRLDEEHAIEIELPFLQHTLGDFALLPIAMMDQKYKTARKLAEALHSVFADENVLYVASSDLSHFYTEDEARDLDSVIMQAVAAYDAAAVITADAEKRGFACGRGAIAAVMLAARAHGATQASIQHYATSGDETGDFAKVVGYGAAIFHA